METMETQLEPFAVQRLSALSAEPKDSRQMKIVTKRELRLFSG